MKKQAIVVVAFIEAGDNLPFWAEAEPLSGAFLTSRCEILCYAA